MNANPKKYLVSVGICSLVGLLFPLTAVLLDHFAPDQEATPALVEFVACIVILPATGVIEVLPDSGLNELGLGVALFWIPVAATFGLLRVRLKLWPAILMTMVVAWLLFSVPFVRMLWQMD